MSKRRNVLTTGEVARICNVASRTVSKWFDNGHLKGYRIPGSGDRRIPTTELIRFMQANNMPTTSLTADRIRILILSSDKETTAELVTNLQNRVDYDIQTAGSDFEAGVAVQKLTPHILLVDPAGTDTNSICKTIRENEELRTIKIVALTNSESSALIQCDFDGFVSDFTDISEIIKTVEEINATVY
ncbi:MAG: helix-turn-helix domain-containing protein [Planctomycetota bacterium]|jgi:excisionase family DNA binding protein